LESDPESSALQVLVDRAAIQDAMCRYARGVDRSDWELVRAAYHPDAYDDHGEFKGDVDGLIGWLKPRFADAENGMHFLGNCLIEFAGPDLALVETSFVTQRLRTPVAGDSAIAGPGQAICRQSWGRYVDRFERRAGEWRVAHRTVVMDSVLTTSVDSAARSGPAVWGRRDGDDYLFSARASAGLAPQA
jgi:hypothetical protein